MAGPYGETLVTSANLTDKQSSASPDGSTLRRNTHKLSDTLVLVNSHNKVTSSWLGAPTHRSATTRIATVMGACVFVRVCARAYVRACVRDVFAIYYHNTLLKIIKGTHVRNVIVGLL